MSDLFLVLNEMSFCFFMAFSLRLGWDYKETFRLVFAFWDWLFDSLYALFKKCKRRN